MNEHGHEGRGAWDMAHFAVIFFGTVIGAAGIVVSSVPVLLAGGALAGWGVLYFAVQQALVE
ncbi:MAG: hypothetical protein HZA90_09615 [Verrucomicrobia bacterium]|nr:hypothetical protein [Verrucomicrobiota bacterium]